MGGGKIRLLTLALTGLLAGCTSKSKPSEPTAPAIYTLTFDANGGALASGTNATQQVLSGEKAQRPADPTRTGYDFTGWTPAQAGGNPFDFVGEPITEARILYAQWTLKTYAVNFDAGGGSPAPPAQQVSHGSQATPPADPTRPGYTFGGWTRDGTDTFDFANTPIIAPLTLYAKWQSSNAAAAATYAVRFDANGGVLPQGTGTTQQLASGSQATRPVDPTRTGYSFAGWTTVLNGADVFDFSRPITEAFTLYAKWEAVASAYTVTLDANGGMLATGTSSTQQIAAGSRMARPADPLGAGYTFLGWTRTRDGSNFFDFATEPITAGLTLYAKWQINNAPPAAYTLTLDANGGALATGTNATQQLASGSRTTWPANPTRSGYTFAGWTRTRDGADTFNFTAETVTANLTLYAKWWNATTTYTLTFDANGGSPTPAVQQLSHGAQATRPVSPTRPNYNFAGWTRTRDGADTFDFSTETVTANLTLYAKWWNANTTYILTFDATGGNPIPPAQQLNYGRPATRPATDPTRANYIFAGWTKTRDGADDFNFTTETVTANITLYAKWTITSRTVTFDPNNGWRGTSQQVDYGSRATPPADPARSGYAFVDWTRTRNGNDSFDFANTPITADLTLYAKWNAPTYAVTFDPNGGSPAPPTQQVIPGDRATPPTTNPTRPGYTFGGWTKTQNGSDTFDFVRETITAARTLYARWNTTVTFDANWNITPRVWNTVQVNYGSRATSPANPTRSGYIFQGWSTTQAGTDTFDLANTPITAPLTLYAKWNAVYTVTFNTNSGALAQGTSATQQVPSGEKAQRPADPTRTNYTFAGWSTTQTGTDTFDFTVETVTADLTLYAKWNITTRTVTFDANGGALATGTNTTQQVLYGEKAQKPADPTRVVYTFLGWAVTQNGTEVFDFDNTPITSNLTLYARWQDQNNSRPAVTYTLTFDANGGALPAGTAGTQQIQYGTLLPSPTRAREGRWDFAFAYWSADKRTKFDWANLPLTRATLYAMWSVAIPDNHFIFWLKRLYVSNAFDGNRLVVNHADVTGLTSMDVSFSSNISDLSGIEFFTALTTLNCSGNQLTALDVSRNTALTTLECSVNRLTALNVSRNTALTSLNCGYNPLASLDMRGMRGVSYLYLGTIGSFKNRNRGLVKVHTNLRNSKGLYDAKWDTDNFFSIEVYDAPAGATNYTKTCSNYQPGNNWATGTCPTP